MTGELLFCTSAASLLIGLGAVAVLLGCIAWRAITEGRRDKGSRS